MQTLCSELIKYQLERSIHVARCYVLSRLLSVHIPQGEKPLLTSTVNSMQSSVRLACTRAACVLHSEIVRLVLLLHSDGLINHRDWLTHEKRRFGNIFQHGGLEMSYPILALSVTGSDFDSLIDHGRGRQRSNHCNHNSFSWRTATY